MKRQASSGSLRKDLPVQREKGGHQAALLYFTSLKSYFVTTCWKSDELSSPANWLSEEE